MSSPLESDSQDPGDGGSLPEINVEDPHDPSQIAQQAIDEAIALMHQMAGNPGQDTLTTRYEEPVTTMGQAMLQGDEPDLDTLIQGCFQVAGSRADSAIDGTSEIIQKAYNILANFFPEVEIAMIAQAQEKLFDAMVEGIMEERLLIEEEAAQEEKMAEEEAAAEEEGGAAEYEGRAAVEEFGGAGIDMAAVEGIAVDVAEFGAL